jgi:hypothetical protein
MAHTDTRSAQGRLAACSGLSSWSEMKPWSEDSQTQRQNSRAESLARPCPILCACLSALPHAIRPPCHHVARVPRSQMSIVGASVGSVLDAREKSPFRAYLTAAHSRQADPSNTACAITPSPVWRLRAGADEKRTVPRSRPLGRCGAVRAPFPRPRQVLTFRQGFCPALFLVAFHGLRDIELLAIDKTIKYIKPPST